MAVRLLRSNFLDGAVFHAYHAFECVVSAAIAAEGVAVPPSHSGRLALFNQIHDQTASFAPTYQRLSYILARTRNEALYFDEVKDIFPGDRFSQAFVDDLLPLVDQFAREAWREIR